MLILLSKRRGARARDGRVKGGRGCRRGNSSKKSGGKESLPKLGEKRGRGGGRSRMVC